MSRSWPGWKIPVAGWGGSRQSLLCSKSGDFFRTKISLHIAGVPGQFKLICKKEKFCAAIKSSPLQKSRCWCPSPIPVENLWGQGGRVPRKLPARRGQAGTSPHWHLVRLDGTGGDRRRSPGWVVASPTGTVGPRHGPPTSLPGGERARRSASRAGAAGRGGGTGTRISAGSGPAPPPTSEVCSFLCLAGFGAPVRGCLGFGLRPRPGRGRGALQAAVSQGSAPADSFLPPGPGARFAMQSHPASQRPALPRDPRALGASPARGPPSLLPLRRSSERKFCNPGQTNAGLAQA